jgi:hypothetical protein
LAGRHRPGRRFAAAAADIKSSRTYGPPCIFKKQPFLFLKKLRRRHRCVYKKTAILKII